MPDYRVMAAAAARKWGLPEWYFTGQIGAESGFNPNARSPAGALGIGQIMPDTARAWGVDPMDPKAALDAAAKNMAEYVKQYGLEGALRAYNAGPGAVEKSKGYDETNAYVRKIMGGRHDEAPMGRGSIPSTETPVVNSQSQRQNPFGTIASLSANQQGPMAETLQRGWDLLGKIWEQKYGGQQQQAPPTPSLASTTQMPTAGGGGGLGGLREAFYDPVGGWKNGQSIGAIGGHQNHDHFGGGPKTMARIVALAQSPQWKDRLTVREYGPVDPVDPVHVKGSYHYRFGNKGAADISGPGQEDFFKEILKRAKWK